MNLFILVIIFTKGVTVDWNAVLLDPSKREIVANLNDTLFFNWTGNHTVYLMESKEKFNACNFTDATLIGDVSPTTYTVTEFPAYFGCALPNHCQNGLKLNVTKGKSYIKYDIIMSYILEIVFDMCNI